MTLALPSISINAPLEEIADCMEHSSVLVITDLPKAPFEKILNLLQHSPGVTTRLNKAFPKATIYKDSSTNSNASSTCGTDRKRSLDISPERLLIIDKADPEVVQSEALQEPLAFYDKYQEAVEDKLIPALCKVIGSNGVKNEIAYSFRMLDYYPSVDENQAIAPRLAEHRDFGYITLIQATHGGLQVRPDSKSKWQDLPAMPSGTAIMMGGWCAKIRSNGRIPAILHRVTKHYEETSRVSAVLFCNPKSVDTALDPVVRFGEGQKFIDGVKAAELQKRLAEAKSEKTVDKWLESCGKKKKGIGLLSKFRRPTSSAA